MIEHTFFGYKMKRPADSQDYLPEMRIAAKTQPGREIDAYRDNWNSGP